MTTLTDVHKNFITWRETRKNIKEKISEALWQQVASIYSSYPQTIFIRTIDVVARDDC